MPTFVCTVLGLVQWKPRARRKKTLRPTCNKPNEGGNYGMGFYVIFKELRSYRDEIETLEQGRNSLPFTNSSK